MTKLIEFEIDCKKIEIIQEQANFAGSVHVYINNESYRFSAKDFCLLADVLSATKKKVKTKSVYK